VTRPHVPSARIRTSVVVPLCFSDGYETTTRVFTFNGLADGREHLALGFGDKALGGGRESSRPPLVRIHSECLTGDVFGSQRCDCGPQVREAVELIDSAGGYLLYLRQEGRGIGLYAKLDAYVLQDAGLDTYEANLALGYCVDARDYTVASQMLLALGITDVELLTNNPDKVAQLARDGVRVTARQPTSVHLTPANSRYLAAKARRGSHAIQLLGSEPTDTPNLSRQTTKDATGLCRDTVTPAEDSRRPRIQGSRARPR
jgi:GTP cyclohydrolase II